MERETNKKLKYPRSIFFIIINEFCERFSFFGFRTILGLYFVEKLKYTKDESTQIFHIFAMLVYTFPLLGAILADSVFGKFRTIFYLSIIYVFGQMILSASTYPALELPIREFSLTGLFLIALGTGGIKPCVAAFGGDQFELPQQSKHLKTYFSIFYWTINSGGVVSALLTTEVRSTVKCFGEQDCYFAAFLIPTILMGLSIIIFGLGRPLYKQEKPTGNIVLKVIKCISCALYNKFTLRKQNDNQQRDHWLDYAEGKYDTNLISDIKATLRVLKLFLPLPLFWALYDQQGSTWTFMAKKMDGQIGNFHIKADQIQVINPMMILCFIPLFQYAIYPMFAKIKLIDTPLKKLTTGGFLAALAFIVSAIVEQQLENTYPILPSDGIAQLRIFNPRNCSLPVTIADYPAFTLEPYGMWQNLEIPVDKNGSKLLSYSANFSACGNYQLPSSGKLEVMEKESVSLIIEPKFYHHVYIDGNNETKSGNPGLRVLAYNEREVDSTKVPMIVKLFNNDKNIYEFKIFNTSSHVHPAMESKLAELVPGTYSVQVNGVIIVPDKIQIKSGGIYTLIVHLPATEEAIIKLVTITPPYSIHILWLIPQYVIITMAEIMFAVTGLEFAFTQAPSSMKALLQAAWTLTTAVGNLIVVGIGTLKLFNSQIYTLYFYAIMMIIAMIIFTAMTYFYEYVDYKSGDYPVELINNHNNKEKKQRRNKARSDD